MSTSENIIFAADNNKNDQAFLEQAFQETHLPFKIDFSKTGEELLKKLEEHYAGTQSFPRMILLDLNMPKPIDGLDTLKRIKSHFLYKTIPVLVLSSEKSDKYIVEAYNLGANSFIVKPATLKEFQDFVNTLSKYWFELAALPINIP